MADDAVVPLASLSLTHVYYDPADPVSYVCAWLALVPQALCVVYATLVWSTREAEVALMFAGQLGCEAVNFALKRLIKEERPRWRIQGGKGYGMPSSHAQFVAFWAVALALFLLVRHRPRHTEGGGERERERERGEVCTCWHGAGAIANEPSASSSGAETPQEEEEGNLQKEEGGQQRHQKQQEKQEKQEKKQTTTKTRLNGGLGDGLDALAHALAAEAEAYAHRPWSLPERAAASALALALAALVAWSRVYLGYHTARQVLVGSAAGVLSAAAWFAATAAARRLGLLAWALQLPPARWLRVRDLVVEEDLPQAGWEKWEERTRAARRAKER